MSADRAMPLLLSIALALASPSIGRAESASQPSMNLDGAWQIAVDKTGESCRVLLRSHSADKTDHVFGMTPACRHSMPDLARVERWSLSDPSHLALADAAGSNVLVLDAAGDGFRAALGGHTYTLTQVAPRTASVGFTPVDTPAASGFAVVIPVVSKRARAATEPQETPSDVGGRYAILRESHDTGCMLTLDDKSRVRGGDRAQLAPGCRDQGIVVFDPTAWQIVKGELVLTARAGHKTHLHKAGEGVWQKDTKDGKPLGLKKL